jgi:hypothetical protein
MEYKRDLLKNTDKSILRVIFGILFCAISILWIIARLADNESIRLFDWFYSGIFVLLGLTHIFAGRGISIESFFGKAFVHIDKEMIDIKLGVFEKEYKIDWREIKSIDCKSGDFTIQKLDNSSIFFPVSKLGYSNVISIKDIISKLAESKDIGCNIH